MLSCSHRLCNHQLIAEAVEAGGPVVATQLQGQGGGRPGRWQGKVARVDQLAAALEQLRELYSQT